MPRSLHPLGHEHVIVQEGVEGILCSVEILERVDERVSEELKRQQLYDFLLRFLETYGAIYLIVESCSFFLPSIKLEGFGWYLFREVSDSVDVVYSPSSIDPSQTVSSESLDAREIVNVPYPTTRDIRNALPFLAGVVKDNNGQIHVSGSATYQTRDQLDGFNVTHPAGGTQRLRFSPDAVRSIQVVDSRYSAEYGKASGGIVNFTTAAGDDQYRFSATNFIPSLQDRKGVHINAWTPRMNFSGPLRKGTAWFLLGLQGDYNLDVVKELPQGQDRNRAWRWNNLAEVQINLTPSNILTAGFLGNRYESDHLGLSRFDPLETTRQRRDQAYLVTLKDQIYLSGALLEIGFAVNEFTTNEQPLGDSPYQIRPGGSGGNFFKQTGEGAQRLQWISNFAWPTHHWHGRHQFKIGTNLDRIGLSRVQKEV